VLKNKYVLAAIILLLLWLLYRWLYPATLADINTDATAKVQRGEFVIAVNTTGELKAKSQTDIMAPSTDLQQASIYSDLKIEDLIAEGTIVDSGEVVASIEKNPIISKLGDVQLEVDKKSSEYSQARLDTTLTLRDAREELSNLRYALEQARLELEQSKYEAPATIRQKQLDLEKTEKSYQQKLQNYITKVKQAETKVDIIKTDLNIARRKAEKLTNLINKLSIKAPKSGMVIYARSWNGQKKMVGSTISPWNPVVATLPDLSVMQVITYINEVDIRKVETGQKVYINLDAEPDKKLTGVITQVANIGEQRPNSDAKVFEVLIDVLEKDTTLRPSMTTGCKVITRVYRDVLYVPLEALNTEDSVSYVFVKTGKSIEKRAVKTAAFNDMHALVYAGLKEGEEVLLSTPGNAAALSPVKLSNIPAPPVPYLDTEWEQMLIKRKLKSKPKS
jgi:multidrug efflux pump subunit AcrA (membrane-fusion protein)